MAMAGGVGAVMLPAGVPAHAALFGEDQARYVLAVPAGDLEAVASAAKADGVPLLRIGTTGGDALTLPGEEAISIATLRNAHESWLPGYMQGPDAIVSA